MKYKRSSGVLVHVTSLPSRTGIGDLGPGAYRFIEFLIQARQRIWQVLPLGPTGYRDSPYQSPSVFAGNPLFISPEILAEQGMLDPEEILPLQELPRDRVDFGRVIAMRFQLLNRAFERFADRAPARDKLRFRSFAASREFRHWLPDFALFCALKDVIGPGTWNAWDLALIRRDPASIEDARRDLAPRIQFHEWLQFQFFEQWMDLKRFANIHGISMVGDTPIFVSMDSSDTWANPHLFQLDERGQPIRVAGVPPDYFSATGQLWGNPLYRWDVHRQTSFRWWIERIKASLRFVDRLRIDHFRGFEACWEIPAQAPTAQTGEWVESPGHELFDAVIAELGDIPLIAEDLGVITPPVVELRDKYGFPGMKILQFAWDGGPDNVNLPHGYPRNCIVYTGTHDNDTTNGWYRSAGSREREAAHAYLGISAERDFSWELIRAAMASVADTSIVPMQDVLSLGNEARMNYPGREEGNWSWRCLESQLTEGLANRLASFTLRYGR